MTHRRITSYPKTPIIALCATVFCSLAALGQATTGTITGRVTEGKGNVVAQATVSVQNLDKGLITEATTDSSGDFTVSAMPPDHYKLVVEKSGFASATVQPFKLDIDQRANFNIPLKVGEVNTIVTVTDSAPVLQTQGAETGGVIGSREIQDLPTQGRDFISLAKLIPGVVSGGGGNNVNLSVNGQRVFSNSIQINGVEVTGTNNDTNVRPSPDVIQEFKIVTSSYGPEFGRSSAGAILIQTKSGTNSIHGSGFLFYRPDATAASPWTASTSHTKTHFTQNNYGGTVGGPIRKDKAFLFAGFEGFRNETVYPNAGATLPGQNQVKYNADGSVDLSGLRDPISNNPVPIFDPYFFQANFYSQQYAGNVIPASQVSPAGRQIVQKLFPAPNAVASGPYANFNSTQDYHQHNNVGNLRADYTPSQNNRFYLTYDAQQGNTSTSDPYAGAIPIAGGGGADTADLTAYENHAIALTYDRVFTSNLLNEARGTYFISPVTQKSLLDGTSLASSFGIQNANIPGFPQTFGFPQIQLGGSGAATGGSTYKPLDSRERIFGLIDSVSYTRQRHTAKLGYEYRNIHSISSYSLFPVPYEYFYGPGSNFTSDPYFGYYDPNAYYYNGGAEIADILLGLPAVVYQGLQLTRPDTSANEQTLYLQDYWQIHPRLNITYGVRYEYVQPFVEANNNESNFDISTLTINIAGRGSNSRSLVNSNTTNLMPRIGADFQITPKTVLRGGFGIFYSPEIDSRDIILTENYPFYTQQKFTNDIYGGFVYKLDTGIARAKTNPVPSSTSSVLLSSVPGAQTQVVSSEPKDFPTAYSKNFNIALERQLGSAMSLEVAYVGAVTRKLSYKVGNYNQGNHLSASLGTVQALFPIGLSNYNALQIKLDRRFQHGYSLLASYTYSHAQDNGPAPRTLGLNKDYPQNPFNISSEYGNSDFDVRQNFVASQIIELPYGRHGKSGNRALGALFGGWQLNSITSLRTGTPINIVSNGNDQTNPGLRPNLTGTSSVGHAAVGQWFNQAAFTVPAKQSQNVIPGSTPRNYITGPGYTNEDVSLFKVISLPREMKFQLRVEAFNVLNTAHYGQPDGDLSHYNFAKKTGTFGTITSGYGARNLQLAGRLTF